MSKQLKKKLQELISNEFMNNCVMEDMTPTMAEIFCWGINNITQKEMKRIIKLHKK